MLNKSNPTKDPTETRLKLLEHIHDGRFPSDYRNAILDNNGNLTHLDVGQWNLFPFSEQPCESCGGTDKTAFDHTDDQCEKDGYPTNAITIGEDSERQFLIFFPGQECYFVWDSDTLLTEFVQLELGFTPQKTD